MRELEKSELDGKDPKCLRVKLHKYIGESCRTSYERGTEHWRDAMDLNEGSHMMKHYLQYHEGESLESMDFNMRVIRYNKTAFARQIQEAVEIQTNIL